MLQHLDLPCTADSRQTSYSPHYNPLHRRG